MKNTAIRIWQFWINKLSLACACLVLGLGTGDATAQPAATAADTSITAIDILLLPDASFTFSPAGAAVYHLGEYGTAAKKLTDLNLKR